jgi:putative ABC transport system permease protein
MQLIRLALKNIRGSGFRSIAIFLAVMSVAGFLLATTLIIAGAQYSLDSGLERLGADILVVPEGAEIKIETALLMGKPVDAWMPRENIQKVANIPGVEAVSPQIYLSSMFDSPCCAVSEMFIVVYDPETDFTIAPWLEKNLGRSLAKGEVIGGNYIFVPEGSQYIRLYGYDTDLVGNLEPTGTGMDQTLFMTLDTAVAMAESSRTTALMTLNIDPDVISTIMVKVAPEVDTHRVALQIREDTDGMVPVESPNLFGTFRNQMNGLLWGFFAITVIVWVVTMILIGILFSTVANERRREMAVLRAVGATRNFIFRSVLTEASLLGLGGAVIGIAFAASSLYIFKDMIAGSLKMPFLFPSIPSFISLFSAGVALAIVSIALSALIPALRLSRQELAIAMRE